MFARLLAAIDNFTAIPITFIDRRLTTSWCSLATAARREPSVATFVCALLPDVHRLHERKAVMFQHYTDTVQWARLMP